VFADQGDPHEGARGSMFECPSSVPSKFSSGALTSKSSSDVIFGPAAQSHHYSGTSNNTHTICSRHRAETEFVILAINTLIAILIIIIIVILILIHLISSLTSSLAIFEPHFKINI
jgi:hypothetical protein